MEANKPKTMKKAKKPSKLKKYFYKLSGVLATIALALGIRSVPKRLEAGKPVESAPIVDTNTKTVDELIMDGHKAFTEELRVDPKLTNNEIMFALSEEYDKNTEQKSNPYEFSYKVSKPQFLYETKEGKLINDAKRAMESTDTVRGTNDGSTDKATVYMVIYKNKIIYSSGKLNNQVQEIYTGRTFGSDARTEILADKNEITSMSNEKIKDEDVQEFIQTKVIEKQKQKQQELER